VKKRLLDLLICPDCLPDEIGLDAESASADGDDILEGRLRCTRCGTRYPVTGGTARVLPPSFPAAASAENKYETAPVVSSYLWSHYGDVMAEPLASDAYRRWTDLITPDGGLAVDAGAAVGRFTFEMSAKCDFAVGLDTSEAFIRAARNLMVRRWIPVALKEEGRLAREAVLTLPDHWESDRVEFIVADALALPFRTGTVRASASLNLVDKVPDPLAHLKEIDRVARPDQAQFLLSDPFSWSAEAAPEERWLGGRPEGPFPGRGLDNITAILSERSDGFPRPWRIETTGEIWWKIRTHANHFELIRSCYLKAAR
jgi:SAM-dependent methyltransferase